MGILSAFSGLVVVVADVLPPDTLQLPSNENNLMAQELADACTGSR